MLSKLVGLGREPVSVPLKEIEGWLIRLAGWLGNESAGLQRFLTNVWRSRGATPADPAVSCEGGGSGASRQTGAGAMEWGVTAAAGKRIDGSLANPAGAACCCA